MSGGRFPVAPAVKLCDNERMIIPKRLPKNSNQRAFEIVRISTGETKTEIEPEPSQVSHYLAKIGRNGGLKGGKARARALSARKRSAIARKAANARWKQD